MSGGESLKKCSHCETFKRLSEFPNDSKGYLGKKSSCKLCSNAKSAKWKSSNVDKIIDYRKLSWVAIKSDVDKLNKKREQDKASRLNRRGYFEEKRRNRHEMLNALHNTLSRRGKRSYAESVFGSKCVLTGETNDVDIDHIIPISWGHGGTYPGNVAPLSGVLNDSKNDRNIYEWLSESTFKSDQLFELLAEQNALTPAEFRSFVDWCDINRRTLDEVKRDQRPSIEIWREATGRHFPLPAYALNEKEAI